MASLLCAAERDAIVANSLDLYLIIGAYRCIEHYEQLRPAIELVRKKEPLQWEAFDYVVGLCRDYLDRRGGLGQG